ncbi:cell division protein CrgA [Nocardioidaceae bacterium SCSIO 66511]|nr:cell division protein CrgA [Nocardioidaceae bacterium SCSIO 66511]
MTDPKNHDDELDDTTSSGEPEDGEVDAPDTEAAEDTSEDIVADEDESVDEDIDDELEDEDEPVEDDIDDDDSSDDDDADDDRRKDKPAASGKASRSGNPARAAEAEGKTRSTRPVKPQKIGNRWAAPAMLACAGIGLLWIVLYYVFANRDNPIPLMSDLGDWNLIVGMAFIVAAFGFSMKWE